MDIVDEEIKLEKDGLQPWWDKLSHFFARVMIAVSVYTITMVNYDEVKCVPTGNTSTLYGTSEYGPAQASYVNAHCAAELPLLNRIFGIILALYVTVANLVECSWLYFPFARKAIRKTTKRIKESGNAEQRDNAPVVFEMEKGTMILYFCRTLLLFFFYGGGILCVQLLPFQRTNGEDFICSINQQLSEKTVIGKFSCTSPGQELVTYILTGMEVLMGIRAFFLLLGVVVILVNACQSSAGTLELFNTHGSNTSDAPTKNPQANNS